VAKYPDYLFLQTGSPYGAFSDVVSVIFVYQFYNMAKPTKNVKDKGKKLTNEIAIALKQVKQIHTGKRKGYTLKDI